MDPLAVAPILSPHGRLTLGQVDDAPALEPALAKRLLDAFARGSGHGLLQLGAAEVGTPLPPVLAYWREFGTRYVTALCTLPDAEERGAARSAQVHVPAPPENELKSAASAAPPMTGAEYLTTAVLHALWEDLDAAFGAELSESKGSVQDLLKHRSPAWNLVGRVHFNLAENRKDEQAPFAFLATYTTRLSAHAKAQHLPLGQALREYAGAANKQHLLSLLLPVQRAAENCAWLKAMVDAGEIFHPLRWTPKEAFQFLSDVPLLESAGVVVRMPATWKANRPPRPQVTATVGGNAPSGLGQDALLDFCMEVTLGGEKLTADEIRELLAKSDGLALVRGRWVEVDRERLSRMLDHFRQVERAAADNGLTFAEAMRMLAGADVTRDENTGRTDADWAQVVAGPWLSETLKGLRSPEGLAQVEPGRAFHGTLRPYQQVGVRWLLEAHQERQYDPLAPVKAFCQFSRKQAALYQQAVKVAAAGAFLASGRPVSALAISSFSSTSRSPATARRASRWPLRSPCKAHQLAQRRQRSRPKGGAPGRQWPWPQTRCRRRSRREKDDVFLRRLRGRR